MQNPKKRLHPRPATGVEEDVEGRCQEIRVLFIMGHAYQFEPLFFFAFFSPFYIIFFGPILYRLGREERACSSANFTCEFMAPTVVGCGTAWSSS
eukprot:jgi/Botrbrau1/18701/Bobra.0386s0027.1